MKGKRTNPLLQDFDNPPFDIIKSGDYLPAFRQAIADARAGLDRISSNPEPPTYENTIAAIDRAGEALERVSGIFFNLLEAEASPDMQKIAEEAVPLVTGYENDYYLHEGLFRRVAEVYSDNEPLAEERSMLRKKVYDGFVRHGALLKGEERERFRQLRRLLSEKCLQYKNNVLAATAAFEMHFTPEQSDAVSGLPETELAIAAERALHNGHEGGWSFDLSLPSYTAYMKFAESRRNRKRLYLAYNSRAFGGRHDNSGLVAEIANLRLELAQLMGYGDYAEYTLSDRMLKTSGEVYGFLERLASAYRPKAEREREEVGAYARRLGLRGGLRPWDWSYYQAKFRKVTCDFDEELLRPYFPLEKVREGIFTLAGRLYGLSFERCTEVPVYHPDVEAYAVRGPEWQVAWLYLDYFPRGSKRNGAWMTSFRDGCLNADGSRVLPQVSLVFNFTPATAEQPSLLSFREVETFLHEFGHGLHGMLSATESRTLSGTSVVRDFVELPSQIMEYWAQEPEFIRLFAFHYRTGEPLPEEWIGKVRASANFGIGYATMRQLVFGMLDMAWHTLRQPFDGDVGRFEDEATAGTRFFPPEPHTCISTAFTHLFGGGYAAGYYGYKWAEALSSDAFAEFEREGCFSREVAARFKNHILERGGSADAMELYVRFKGRKPDAAALQRRHGV